MATFKSVNQPESSGTPQFTQPTPVRGNDGGGIASLVNLGANIFSQVSTARKGREEKEVATASNTALGGLQQGLLDIRQASQTDSSIDVTRQSRLLLTQFNTDHPELRMEASKAYKAETGATPSGLSADEEAENDLRNNAIANGFGSHGASEEHNEEQFELFQDLKRQDKVLSSKIQKMSVQVQEGSIHKSALKETVLSSFHELSGNYTAKTQGDMKEMITQFHAGTLPMEEAMLMIRESRNKIGREIATLGEFSTDPTVQAYIKPSLDSLQLAEDIISGKVEGEAVDAVVNLNKARAKAIFMSDPDTVNLVVASEAFNHTTGIQSKISKSVMKFLVEGLTEEGMLPVKPKPVNPTTTDKDEQDGIKTVLERMVEPASSPEAKLEAANTLTGVAEHLSRNGMDYSPENKKFAIDVLNTEGAMEILTSEQKSTVMLALDMYVVDTVDLAVKEAIANPSQVSTSSAAFPRVLGGSGPDMKNFADVADLTVVDGRIYWTVKRGFAGDSKVRQQIRAVNQRIDDDITPAVNVYSKGLGKSFEEVAGAFLGTEQEESKEEAVTPPKTKAGVSVSGVEDSLVTGSTDVMRQLGIEPTVTSGVREESADKQASIANMTTKATSAQDAKDTYAEKYHADIDAWHSGTGKEKKEALVRLKAIRDDSVGQHSVGGALDFRSKDLTTQQKKDAVEALNAKGFRAILENEGGDNEHIHVEEVE